MGDCHFCHSLPTLDVLAILANTSKTTMLGKAAFGNFSLKDKKKYIVSLK